MLMAYSERLYKRAWICGFEGRTGGKPFALTILNKGDFNPLFKSSL